MSLEPVLNIPAQQDKNGAENNSISAETIDCLTGDTEHLGVDANGDLVIDAIQPGLETSINIDELREPPLDKPYLSLLKDVEFKPIFILGSARSGTTILYKLLANTGCFNYMKAYHVLKYDRILFDFINKKQNRSHQELNDLYADLGVGDRFFDQVTVDSNMPKEYRSIWQNQENLSPREVVSEVLRTIFLQGKTLGHAICKAYQLDAENISVFTEACKKTQFSSDQEKPLLLKNPWDFSNFTYIKSMFPEAKFVFIHRHPLNILNSQLMCTSSSLQSKNNYLTVHSSLYTNLYKSPLIRPILSKIFLSPHLANARQKIITGNLRNEELFFVNNIGSLPEDDYINVKYEDLCKSPNHIVPKILDFLGAQPNSHPDYRDFIQPRSLSLLPEINQTRQNKICRSLEKYLDFHGYTYQHA